MILSLLNSNLESLPIYFSSGASLLRQLPHEQKCLPPYMFFNSFWVSNTFFAPSALTKPANLEAEPTGGTELTKWTWFFCTFRSFITRFFQWQSSLRISNTNLWSVASKILHGYLGHRVKWYPHLLATCANRSKALIARLILVIWITSSRLTKEVIRARRKRFGSCLKGRWALEYMSILTS